MNRVRIFLLLGLIVSSTALLAGPRTTVARAADTTRGTIALESLSPEESQGAQNLTTDNPGQVAQKALTQGIQLSQNGYVEYALDGRYTVLSGMLYSDDNSGSTTGTIVFVDASQRTPTILARIDVPQGAHTGFRVSLRGVSHVMIEQVQCCGIDVDVVASLTSGPRVTPPAVTGTALEAVTLDTAQGSQFLTLDNPGHYAGVLIADGFQLSQNAFAQYALNGGYKTLAGTVYNDDTSGSTTATLLIADDSSATPRVLLRADVPQQAHMSFHISVSGVRHLMVQQTQCCGVNLDVVATLQRGGASRPSPAHPHGSGAHGVQTALEAVTLDTAQGNQFLTVDNPGHYTGVLLTHGFQLGQNASAEFALNGRYTTLAGTLYNDDTSGSTTGTILVVDATNATPRVLLRADVPQRASKTFRVSVRGVRHLMVQQTQCCGINIDIIATLTH